MKIVIAPDKFKGSLTASEVCEAAARGIRRAMPDAELLQHPLGDGGEGTLEILADHLSLKRKDLTVSDPLFRKIKSHYYYSADTAYVELALQSGLTLLKSDERNVLKTTTLGTGEVITDALKTGLKQIVLMIGGSATNDAGTGILKALGYRFFNEEGTELAPLGENLIKIKRIRYPQTDWLATDVNFSLICDVKNPFYGPDGAAQVYAGQKGVAGMSDIKLLDRGLENFAELVRIDTGTDLQSLAGAGAAGGVGGGLHAFLQAKVLPGTETILHLTKFTEIAKDADLIITGEGKVDHQTISGKVVKGVTDYCTRMKIPSAILCGICQAGLFERSDLMMGCYPIKNKEVTIKEAISNAGHLLEDRAYQLATDFISNRKDP